MTTIVERCELSPGFTVSRILTGLWQIADMERNGCSLDLKATAEAMIPYVDAGFTTFDMADHYGSAEQIAGLFLNYHSPNVEFLTKWVPSPGTKTKKDVRAAVQRSLNRIQTDRLDLLQFHTWNYADPNWLDQLYWLQELKDEGLIHYLSLVNFDTIHLRIVLKSGIDIVSNQVSFSLLDRRAKSRMTELCLAHGIRLLAFGTVAGGFLSEKWLGKPEPDFQELNTWSQMKYKRFIDVAGGWGLFQDLLKEINNVAQEHSVSIANVACRYILDQPSVAAVIIGARLGKIDHIKDNLRLFQFILDKKSRLKIEESVTKLKPIPGDCGDEYRKPPFLTATGDLSHHIESLPPPYASQSSDDGHRTVLCHHSWDDADSDGPAIRQGDRINIVGINPTHGNHLIGGTDVTAQLDFVIDKLDGAVQSLGAHLKNVVQTRIYVRYSSDYEKVARTHRARLPHMLSENTSIRINPDGFSRADHLVKMDAEAVVASD